MTAPACPPERKSLDRDSTVYSGWCLAVFFAVGLGCFWLTRPERTSKPEYDFSQRWSMSPPKAAPVATTSPRPSQVQVPIAEWLGLETQASKPPRTTANSDDKDAPVHRVAKSVKPQAPQEVPRQESVDQQEDKPQADQQESVDRPDTRSTAPSTPRSEDEPAVSISLQGIRTPDDQPLFAPPRDGGENDRTDETSLDYSRLSWNQLAPPAPNETVGDLADYPSTSAPQFTPPRIPPSTNQRVPIISFEWHAPPAATNGMPPRQARRLSHDAPLDRTYPSTGMELLTFEDAFPVAPEPAHHEPSERRTTMFPMPPAVRSPLPQRPFDWAEVVEPPQERVVP